MAPSGLLLSNPPSLSKALKLRTNELRSRIVKANYNTQFTRTAPELAEFRGATADTIDGLDDDTLSETFQKMVCFTTYDSYAPLVARLIEKPRKASGIVDLLAPGMPDFVVRSSSTSGGLPKYFPRYNVLSTMRASDPASSASSNPLRRRTKAYVFHFWCHPMNVEDDDGCSVATIYLNSSSALSTRRFFLLDPEKDEEKMGSIVFDHVAPYAVGFIKKWHSFLVMHTLFAVISRSLETMSMAFINTFVDMIRHLDMEFDMVVDCIANGTIPDLDGIAEVRHYLEPSISPDPERAAELRLLGRPSSRPGWCGYVWPNLHSVTAISSGSFASSVPLARWFLGPNTDIHTRGFTSSEGWIGSVYSSLELNQFKLDSVNIVEFLNDSRDGSMAAIMQPWEVESGKRYELVLTTQDGLWRYRIGDVVEISGFDPTDGAPVFQFVERCNMAIRFPGFTIVENELTTAVSSVVPKMTVKVVNWTTAADGQSALPRIIFFVELASDPVSDLSFVPESVFQELSRLSQRVAWAVTRDLFYKPVFRLVRSGTFSDFLQLKLDESGGNLGQVKVPVVLPKLEYTAWFSNRVLQEL